MDPESTTGTRLESLCLCRAEEFQLYLSECQAFPKSTNSRGNGVAVTHMASKQARAASIGNVFKLLPCPET